MNAGQRTHKRRQILVDRPMQLSVALALVGVFLGMSVIYATAFLLLSDSPDRPSDFTAHEARLLGLAVNGAYFLIVLALVLFVSIRVTHRIAGPARVIEGALEAMQRGDMSARLTLRKNDHLQSLATSLARHRSQVVSEREAVAALHGELREALDAGDVPRARRLLEDFGELRTPGPPPAAALPASGPSPVEAAGG